MQFTTSEARSQSTNFAEPETLDLRRIHLKHVFAELQPKLIPRAKS